MSFLKSIQFDNSGIFLYLIIFVFSWFYTESSTKFELRRPVTKSNTFVSGQEKNWHDRKESFRNDRAACVCI